MRNLGAILAMSAIAAAPVIAADEAGLFQAVRSGDLAYLRSHVSAENLEARDRRGATLLMHAAAFGNLETLQLLLDRGANVNGHNDFEATALLWSARDPEKARVLIEHGANVNARSKQGRTPLMLACLRPGGASTVALMLAKGAEVNVKDGRGDSALGLAASIGEAETMRLLLAKGADPDALNEKGESPLILATKSKNAEPVRILLLKHVDVNVANTSNTVVRNGKIAMIGLAPLHRAAAFGPPEMVSDLLKAGAKVDARDSRGLTPLMFAVATEYPSAEIVRTLMRAGADVNAQDTMGATALDWADKFGYPEILAELKKASAERKREYQAPKFPETPRPQPTLAVTRGMAMLEKTGTGFFKDSGCVACHHQPLIARAQHALKTAGLPVNEALARDILAQMKGQWLASQEEFLQSINPGGGPNRLAENLLGLEQAGYAPDAITDSAVIDLAESQAVDGRFPPGDEQPRPPITESTIASTARTIRALQAYTIPARRTEFEARIARARAWLLQVKPRSTDDYTMRLMGLAWSGAQKSEIESAVRELLALQHEDGGWSGNPHQKSDAFSTGVALSALAESKLAARETYRRGVDYLLRTQYPDGSWYVRSRAIKFQPYFESGFPFGHDQWISTAATAWATQAIAFSLGAPDTAAAR